jgi:outer membrane lipoprotein-sorting protein
MDKMGLFSIYLSLMWMSPAFSQAVMEKQLPPKEIVERAEANLRGKNNYGAYTMVVHTPNWERSLSLEAWDDRSNNRAFIKISSPPKDKNTLFLRVGYSLWIFLPQLEKIIKIPPSMMLQPWMGSDFNNDDLVKESSLIQDYTHRILAAKKINQQEVLEIELLPKPEAAVVWGKIVYWVIANEFIPLREHFYDEKGRLIKELRFSETKLMGGRKIPTLYEMIPSRKEGHHTLLKIETMKFDQKFDEDLFSMKNLRKGRS